MLSHVFSARSESKFYFKFKKTVCIPPAPRLQSSLKLDRCMGSGAVGTLNGMNPNERIVK
jgi:hypothetical protein